VRRLEASVNHSSENERTFPPNAADIKSKCLSVQVVLGMHNHVCGLGKGGGSWIIPYTKKHNVSLCCGIPIPGPSTSNPMTQFARLHWHTKL
jgi:hypothetical protein